MCCEDIQTTIGRDHPICFLSRPCPCSLSPRYREKGVSRSLLCRIAGVLTVWYVPITALKMSSCDMLHAILSLGSRLASPATMTRPHSADLPLNTTLKKLPIDWTRETVLRKGSIERLLIRRQNVCIITAARMIISASLD